MLVSYPPNLESARRAGNGIGHVIVAALGMRDGVPANRAGATLKPYDLALKAIIARRDDAATVRARNVNVSSVSRQGQSTERNAFKLLCRRHRLLGVESPSERHASHFQRWSESRAFGRSYARA